MSANDDAKVQIRRVDGYWSMVPEWLIDKKVSGNAIHLFAVLDVKWANKEDGRLWPSRRTIAETMGRSTSTVDRAMRELIAVGAVKVTRRRDEKNEWTSSLIEVFHNPHVTDGATSTSPVTGPSTTGGEQTKPNEPENDSCQASSTPDADRLGDLLLARKEEIIEAYGAGEPWALEVMAIIKPLALAPSPREPIDPVTTQRAVDMCNFFIDTRLQAVPDWKAPVRPNRQWIAEAERMLRIDRREPKEIAAVIRWALLDPAGNFWVANLQSIPTLRKQYDQLREQMNRKPAAPAQRSSLPAPSTGPAVPQFLPGGAENPAWIEAEAEWERRLAEGTLDD